MEQSHYKGEEGSFSIVRRLGLSPQERGSGADVGTCPDLFELSNGDFAIIGIDRTDVLRHQLPDDAGIADYERLVVVSRAALLAAKVDIPDA